MSARKPDHLQAVKGGKQPEKELNEKVQALQTLEKGLFHRLFYWGTAEESGPLPFVVEILSPSDFLKPQHRTLFKVVSDLNAQGEAASQEAVLDELARRDELAAAGGFADVVELFDGVLRLPDTVSVARRIRRNSLERELLKAHEALSRDLGDEWAEKRVEDVRELIEGLDSDAPNARQQNEIKREARWNDTSISFVFSSPPPKREFLVEDFFPANESGLLIAKGGTGKGHLEIHLGNCLALGESFGSFEVAKARGTVIVSLEEDREEIWRREHAAVASMKLGDESDSEWAERRAHIARELERRIRFVGLRGVTGTVLGTDLRDRVLRVLEDVEDPGLVIVDPIGRFVPKGIEINSQAGAGIVVSELDALREATSCAVWGSYHVNKEAVRNGGELNSGASSGSLQLEDLARWVLNLKSLKRSEASGYGLDPGAYVEAAVSKSNYAPPLSAPLVFRRGKGGELLYVAAKNRDEVDDQVALAELFRADEWLTRDEWREAVKELDLSKHRADGARKRLEERGSVERVTLREGRTTKDVFAPGDAHRPERWPAAPTTLAELGNRE